VHTVDANQKDTLESASPAVPIVIALRQRGANKTHCSQRQESYCLFHFDLQPQRLHEDLRAMYFWKMKVG
jgi:hypothetical protein